MMVDRNTPEFHNLLIAFDGEVVGPIIQADTDKGFIIQAKYSSERQMFYGHETKHGKVAILGDIDKDSRETLLANLNKHRADCGLGPYQEFADIQHPLEVANIKKPS